jgi:hypothetical protein
MDGSNLHAQQCNGDLLSPKPLSWKAPETWHAFLIIIFSTPNNRALRREEKRDEKGRDGFGGKREWGKGRKGERRETGRKGWIEGRRERREGGEGGKARREGRQGREGGRKEGRITERQREIIGVRTPEEWKTGRRGDITLC